MGTRRGSTSLLSPQCFQGLGLPLPWGRPTQLEKAFFNMCSLYCVGRWSGIMREWNATSFMFFCFILVSLFFFFFMNLKTFIWLFYCLFMCAGRQVRMHTKHGLVGRGGSRKCLRASGPCFTASLIRNTWWWLPPAIQAWVREGWWHVGGQKVTFPHCCLPQNVFKGLSSPTGWFSLSPQPREHSIA